MSTGLESEHEYMRNYTLNGYMSWKIARYTRNYCCGRKQSRGLRVSECRYGLRVMCMWHDSCGVTMFMWVQWAVWWLLRTRLELVSKGHEVLQDVTGTPLPFKNWLQLTITTMLHPITLMWHLLTKLQLVPSHSTHHCHFHMTLRFQNFHSTLKIRCYQVLTLFPITV